MTPPLTREEYVWVQAYCAHANDSELQIKQLVIYADAVLEWFKNRFPASPSPQGVFVTKSKIKEIFDNEDFWYADGNICERFCKELGLGE